MAPVEHTPAAQPVDVTPFTARRTHFCGELSEANVGNTVTLNGWVSVNRDLGGIVFIEIRDRSGLFQLVADPQKNPDVHKVLHRLHHEDVIAVTGPVSKRPAETVNANLPTGSIEMYPTSVQVLNKAKPLPFQLDEADNVDEQVRLKYRYLDLRRPEMFRKLKMRHDITQTVRRVLNGEGFMEVETPILIKTTPEGARDYLVPSRVHAGKAFALPQSPQLFKQILMMSGVERYYQIARCFRDEDLRADRQPEFTQVDLEMSFVNQEDVMALMEKLVPEMFAVGGVKVKAPFQRMTWHEAMSKYGSDKPDLRFGMEFVDLSDIFASSDFGVFRDAVQKGGVIKALKVEGAAEYSRKELDDLQVEAKRYGAKGLAYIIYNEDGPKSPILKYMSEAEQAAIQERTGAKVGDGVFFMAEKFIQACTVLGRFRLKFGEKHGLIRPDDHKILWVVDFPMFEVGDDGSLAPNHHPFTSPHPEDLALLDSEPGKARSLAYDLVYNGTEIGGGSIRIHNPSLQAKLFSIIGLSDEVARDQFGFLVEALKFGAPPHGGLALGLDRICAMLAGAESIRDVIAFPKTNAAICPMTDAPGTPSEDQLKELHFRWVLPQPKEK
jgi:aspartyl-tRNA synthetase